ncbi:lipase member M-like [Tiliqua scincoides]|uniref:lipase member M-like n=1 Tax=Tiliqua scincoides TaxID=71010 RepID=UPI00346364C1
MVLPGTVRPEEATCKTEVNPELSMNISQRIQYWGYPSEEYEVLTEDGYYLSVNRIPGGLPQASECSKAAILLMHGLTLEGSNWIANPPPNSLGFMLADAGYDVWIGNSRGNSWSRRHRYLTVDQVEFWNFSFHEMGIYDLPAMINFILQKTGQEKIYYGGHAQGSTIAFVAFSTLPRLAEKVKIFFSMGPAYTFQFSLSPILQLTRLPAALLEIIFGKKEFCLLSPTLRASIAQKCGCRLIDNLCKQALFLVSGFNEKNLNMSRTDVYISRFPDYTSVKNFLHWGQSAKTGKFRYFDYGSENIEVYNQTTPPFYKLEDIFVPIAMWSGGQDWVCQPTETAELKSRLNSIIHYKEIPDWVHWDFIWGIDAPQWMYTEILHLMENQL